LSDKFDYDNGKPLEERYDPKICWFNSNPEEMAIPPGKEPIRQSQNSKSDKPRRFETPQVRTFNPHRITLPASLTKLTEQTRH
jgi:hypothetical protein